MNLSHTTWKTSNRVRQFGFTILTDREGMRVLSTPLSVSYDPLDAQYTMLATVH
jgi:hypothetical protein